MTGPFESDTFQSPSFQLASEAGPESMQGSRQEQDFAEDYAQDYVQEDLLETPAPPPHSYAWTPVRDALLAGQVIAISETDSGFGRSIAVALAHRGATVVLLSANSEVASQLSSHIETFGGTALPIKTDLSSPLDYAASQSKILELYGHLSGVIHLADKGSPSSFDYLGLSEWNELLSQNLRSSMGVLQTLHRQLPRSWLVVIAPPTERKLHLYVLRGALEGMTRGAALEKMRVNLLIPSRPSGGEEYDAELSELVCTLANPRLAHIGGNVLEVPLPPLPRMRQTDLELDIIPENLL